MSIFEGELSALDQVDIDAPISDAPVRWPLLYSDNYGDASKQAQTDGKVDEECAYRFLERILSIMPTFYKKEQPYSPYREIGMHRSEVPSDFSATDIEAIRRILARTSDPTLQAHLNDMLFVGPSRDHQAGTQAASLFLQIGPALQGTNNSSLMRDALLRGIQLARQMGWRKALGESARVTLCGVIRSCAEEPFNSDLDFSLRLAHEESIGDALEWRKIAQQAGDFHKAQVHPNNAQAYFKLVLAFSQTLNDLGGEHSAWREIGRALEKEAQERASQQNASFMAASSILKEAIQAMRKGSAGKDEVDPMLEQLRIYQEQGKHELGRYGRDFDATSAINEVRQRIRGQPLGNALFTLALGTRLTEVEKLKERVLENARKFPLLYLFKTRVLDDKGRDRQIQRGIHNLQGAEYEKALRQRMFSEVQFDWNYRAQIFIDTARRQLLEEHSPGPEDLHPLVWNNPFIPPDREGLFLRGLLAGLNGDFVSSSHLLTLQFENSIRYVLESKGIHVSNIHEDGTEPLKVWGGLLDLPETIETFGEDRLFELEGLLVSQDGFGFRNKLAHGLLTEAQCGRSIPAICVWWLMLHLCMEQVANRFQTEPTPD